MRFASRRTMEKPFCHQNVRKMSKGIKAQMTNIRVRTFHGWHSLMIRGLRPPPMLVYDVTSCFTGICECLTKVGGQPDKPFKFKVIDSGASQSSFTICGRRSILNYSWILHLTELEGAKVTFIQRTVFPLFPLGFVNWSKRIKRKVTSLLLPPGLFVGKG